MRQQKDEDAAAYLRRRLDEMPDSGRNLTIAAQLVLLCPIAQTERRYAEFTGMMDVAGLGDCCSAMFDLAEASSPFASCDNDEAQAVLLYLRRLVQLDGRVPVALPVAIDVLLRRLGFVAGIPPHPTEHGRAVLRDFETIVRRDGAAVVDEQILAWHDHRLALERVADEPRTLENDRRLMFDRQLFAWHEAWLRAFRDHLKTSPCARRPPCRCWR